MEWDHGAEVLVPGIAMSMTMGHVLRDFCAGEGFALWSPAAGQATSSSWTKDVCGKMSLCATLDVLCVRAASRCSGWDAGGRKLAFVVR